MSETNPPLIVNVIRGQQIECSHQVSAVVVNSDSQTLQSWGESDLKIFPRSSIKPLQALALFQSGAYDQFQITDQELVLACASHSGEKPQTDLIQTWLKRLNLSIQDLECGTHYPSHQNATIELLNSHEQVSPIHNNCSGKHTGMLAACLSLRVPTKGYTDRNHPLQIMIKEILEDFCDTKITSDDTAIDGCSIPTYFLNLKKLALAVARFSAPTGRFEKYKKASHKIINAISQNPYYLGGTDRYCTKMTQALKGQGFVKTGAEGVMFACLPEKRIGIALKVTDGTTRGAELSMSFILNKLGVLTQNDYSEFSKVEVKNWNQIVTGYIEVKKP